MTAKRARATVRRKKGTIKRVDIDLRVPAQALLTTSRSIKQSLADETASEERRRLRRLLNRALRKLRAYRKGLEAIALQVPPLARAELEEQIHLFLLLEDECRISAEDRRHGSN